MKHLVLFCHRRLHGCRPPVTYLRLQHDLCQLPPLLSGETLLLELLKAVSKPLLLLQAAQLAGLH